MNVITIPQKIAGKDDLVILPRKEFEYMKSRMFPIIHLKGKSATRLDKRVENAIRDYRAGRTKKIRSLSDLD